MKRIGKTKIHISIYVSTLNKKIINITIKRRAVKITGIFLLFENLGETLCIRMPATKNGTAFQKAKTPIHCKKS